MAKKTRKGKHRRGYTMSGPLSYNGGDPAVRAATAAAKEQADAAEAARPGRPEPEAAPEAGAQAAPAEAPAAAAGDRPGDAAAIEPAYAYTRSEAIADGELVDVTEIARRHGFRHPFALSRAVWDQAVLFDGIQPSNGDAAKANERLNTLLAEAAQIAKSENVDRIQYPLGMERWDKEGLTLPDLSLVLHCGPGDTEAPVLTLMLPSDA